jgi:hypothetical protein
MGNIFGDTVEIQIYHIPSKMAWVCRGKRVEDAIRVMLREIQSEEGGIPDFLKNEDDLIIKVVPTGDVLIWDHYVKIAEKERQEGKRPNGTFLCYNQDDEE